MRFRNNITIKFADQTRKNKPGLSKKNKAETTTKKWQKQSRQLSVPSSRIVLIIVR